MIITDSEKRLSKYENNAFLHKGDKSNIWMQTTKFLHGKIIFKNEE